MTAETVPRILTKLQWLDLKEKYKQLLQIHSESQQHNNNNKGDETNNNKQQKTKDKSKNKHKDDPTWFKKLNRVSNSVVQLKNLSSQITRRAKLKKFIDDCRYVYM